MGAARFATAGAVMAVLLGGVLLGAPTVAVAGTAADAPAPRAVAAPPVLGGTAALTGEAVMAQELAVRLEGWADGTTFDYQWLRRLLAIVLIALGALVGAALLRLGLEWGIGLAAVVTVAVAVLGHVGRPLPSSGGAQAGAA